MKIPRKQQGIILSIAAALVALGITAYGGYQRGYRHGQKDEAAKHVDSQAIDDAFKNAANFFQRSSTGTITKISDKQLVIKLATGKDQTIALTDKTTYVRAAKKVTAKDLKKDQKVTILLSETDRTQAARVTIK